MELGKHITSLKSSFYAIARRIKILLNWDSDLLSLVSLERALSTPCDNLLDYKKYFENFDVLKK